MGFIKPHVYSVLKITQDKESLALQKYGTKTEQLGKIMLKIVVDLK